MNALASWMDRADEGDDTLAEKVGVSRVQISRIRRNLSRPSPELAAKLEVVTGVPAWDLIKPAETGDIPAQDAA